MTRRSPTFQLHDNVIRPLDGPGFHLGKYPWLLSFSNAELVTCQNSIFWAISKEFVMRKDAAGFCVNVHGSWTAAPDQLHYSLYTACNVAIPLYALTCIFYWVQCSINIIFFSAIMQHIFYVLLRPFCCNRLFLPINQTNYIFNILWDFQFFKKLWTFQKISLDVSVGGNRAS